MEVRSTSQIWRVEFHCHTRFSKDSLVDPEALIVAGRKRGLDRLVVTDHNTIAGALKAQEIDPELVIVGEEIMTDQGELLAAFVKEEIPGDLPVGEAVRRLKEQGAFISVSHPFDRYRGKHWSRETLNSLQAEIDAIETFNARCFPPAFNREAQAFAAELGVPGTAGSDAHTLYELGRAVMLLAPFADGEELRSAIRQVKFEVKRTALWVRLASRFAVLKKALTDN